VIASDVTVRRVPALASALVGVLSLAALVPAASGAPSKHPKHARAKRAPPAAVASPAAAPRDDANARLSPADPSGSDSRGGPGSEPDTATAAPDAPALVERSERGSARAPRPSDDESPSPADDDPPAAGVPRGTARSPAPAAARLPTVDDVAGAALTDEDARWLGRREAARVAAGRIEVAVWAGIDAGRRVFTYSDPVGAPPQAYRLPFAPLATFGLEAYPLASTDIPVARDLGFRARVSRGFAMESSTTDGVPLQDSWTRFAGDLRQRVLLPKLRGLELGFTVGVDASYFDLRTEAAVGSLVPAARMLSLRFGLDGKVAVTRRLSALASGGYLATLSRGQIYDRFRQPHVAGLDALVGAAFAVVPGVEVRLEARYTRYFASFAPEVGDPAVAGGALDEQMQLGVGLRYAH